MTSLDIGLALKIVDKFAGDGLELGHFLETIDLLTTYSTGVSHASIISFVKTRLISSAHGAIEGATTIDEVKHLLKSKFAIKLTPSACEAEMKQAKQKNMSISEYGKIVEQLAAKLATAHVSTKTFPNEAAADAIVQPAAVNAFVSGLNNSQIAFFVKARNPPSLNRAISDALEVVPNNREEVNWYQPSTSWGNAYRSFRGNRGNYQRGRSFRGRGYGNHSRGYQNQNNNYASRGQYNHRGNGGNRPPRARGSNTRGTQQRGPSQCCNCTEEGRPQRGNQNQAEQSEEVNTLQELFRE